MEQLSIKESSWIEKAQQRTDNYLWLSRSRIIALQILRKLRETGTSQKELADRMGVFPQQVNKWIKGKENFTLETIGRIEEALGIELIEVKIPGNPPNNAVTGDEVFTLNEPSIRRKKKE